MVPGALCCWQAKSTAEKKNCGILLHVLEITMNVRGASRVNSMTDRVGEPNKHPPIALTTDFLGEDRHEFVAKLAYKLWEERGRPFGSPEADWFAAERAVYSSLLSSGLVTSAASGPQHMAEKIYR
jgi:Protein of unknown function (DUF2934)